MKKAGRFWGALFVAWSCTVASVVLAVVPALEGGRYSPQVAVLTATLIGVIWYTYFSYQATHRVEPAKLRFDLKANLEKLRLHVIVENLSTRLLTARLVMRMWGDEGRPFEPEDIFDGGEDSEIMVGPHEKVVVSNNIPPMVLERGASSGSYAMALELRIALWLTWQDEYGSPGKSHPRFWHVRGANPTKVTRVFTRRGILRHFSDLEWGGRDVLAELKMLPDDSTKRPGSDER